MENNTETDKILLKSGIFFKAKLDIFMGVFLENNFIHSIPQCGNNNNVKCIEIILYDIRRMNSNRIVHINCSVMCNFIINIERNNHHFIL